MRQTARTVSHGRCLESGKIAYPNKGEAKKAAHRCILKGAVKEFGVYPCRHCKHWHLTHIADQRPASSRVSP